MRDDTGYNQYKAFSLLSMIYITFILSADVLIYKLIHVGSLVMTVGSFITPFWFVLADISAEVYGYQLTRRLIWSGILCGLVFTIIAASLIQLPSPEFWHYQPAYDQVLGKLPRIFIGSFAGVILGGFLNAYLISRWKILLHGKYFWLRSLGSSGTGQLVFTLVTVLFDLTGVVPIPKIIQIITISLIIKISVEILLTLPSMFLVKYLKQLEGIDVYDYNINFSPFKLEVA
jgi:queuosine precursor transporter